MQNLNEIKNTFDLNQTRKFLKAIKGNKFECNFKLIMTYQISRMELVKTRPPMFIVILTFLQNCNRQVL